MVPSLATLPVSRGWRVSTHLPILVGRPDQGLNVRDDDGFVRVESAEQRTVHDSTPAVCVPH